MAFYDGIASQALQLVGDYFNNKFAQQQQDKAFEQNKQLAGYQNSLNIAQWERENAYNDPKAQLQRYRDAGLNPNAIYGDQNLSANSPQLVGGSPMQPIQQPLLSPSTLSQSRLIEAQIRNLDADSEKKGAEKQLTFSQIDLNGVTKEKLKKDMNLTDAEVEKVYTEIDVCKKTIEKIGADIGQISANTDLIKVTKDGVEIDNRYKDQHWNALIDNLVEGTKLTREQANEVVTLLTARLANIQADTSLKGEQRELVLKQVEQLENLIKQGKADVDLFTNDEGDYTGFYKALRYVREFMNSFLGWFSGGVTKKI